MKSTKIINYDNHSAVFDDCGYVDIAHKINSLS
jgi:hypothetical protein